MTTFLLNNGGTILLSAVLVVAVAGIVRHLVRQKRLGGSSCGCGCQGCAGHCHPHTED